MSKMQLKILARMEVPMVKELLSLVETTNNKTQNPMPYKSLTFKYFSYFFFDPACLIKNIIFLK